MAPKSTLCFLSDDCVDKIASFDLGDSYNLYDSRFGSVGNVNFECLTCGFSGDKCLGHNAKLSLNCKIFHPLAYKKICEILNHTCLFCNTKLDATQKNNRCTLCDNPVYKDYYIPVYKEQNKEKHNKRNKRNSEYNKNLYCIVRKSSHHLMNQASNVSLKPEDVEDYLPKGYVISKILVPPINIRTPFDVEYITDLHRLYQKLVYLVKNNDNTNNHNLLSLNRKATTDHDYAINVSKLYEKIVGSNKNEGIMGMLGTKSGVFRQIMQGKRVDKCARAVITPDPHLPLDCIAIPLKIASTIRVLESVSKFNIDKLKSLAFNMELWWQESGDVLADPRHIVDGMVFYRKLSDGDLVLFNRQPSLSRISILCFSIKIKHDNSNTLGMNPQIVSPFNADFDGDEMNVFFGISNNNTHDELRKLCSIQNNVIVDDTLSIKPIQDIITGCYLMSIHDSPVSDSVIQMCEMFYDRDTVDNYYTEISSDRWADYKEIVTTHSILRACINGYNGDIITKNTLIKYLKHHPDPLVMIEKLQHTVITWLSQRGLSVTLETFNINRSILFNKDNKDDYDNKSKFLLHSLENTDVMHMIKSGAKGQMLHLQHMAASLGQQIVANKPSIFCYESYTTGLTPEEFFGHQMAAREGVVKTGVSTSESGYLNRRSCKIMADIIVQHNGVIGDKYFVSTFPQ